MQTITQKQMSEKIQDNISRGGGIEDIQKRVYEDFKNYTIVENNERCKLCGDLVYGIIQIHHHN